MLVHRFHRHYILVYRHQRHILCGKVYTESKDILCWYTDTKDIIIYWYADTKYMVYRSTLR